MFILLGAVFDDPLPRIDFQPVENIGLKVDRIWMGVIHGLQRPQNLKNGYFEPLLIIRFQCFPYQRFLLWEPKVMDLFLVLLLPLVNVRYLVFYHILVLGVGGFALDEFLHVVGDELQI